MAKRLTVFYSWQSDSPSNLNRSFIEKALQKALSQLHSDATLENALRDATVELDKDTQNVAGSPPIAETILRKIENCAVFVADLSFVGQSKNGFTNASGNSRQFSNPNVVMEYGYALRCHSHTKLVGIMNTAYGKPDSESLPFDLRHLRWPIVYHLADASAPDKERQFDGLVQTLEKAIGLILASHPPVLVQTESFIPQKSTRNAAIFFDNAADLVGDRQDVFTVPEGGKMYLRLYPSVSVPPIGSELDARDLAVNGNLQPMGRVRGWSFDRNIFGGIAYESPQDRNLYHFTQLFLSGEIWGLDAEVLNANHIRAQLQQWVRDDSLRYIANGYVEEYLVKALHNFRGFSQSHLHLPLPLEIEAGLTGVKGYSLAINFNRIIGKALRDTVQWRGQIVSYEQPAWEILAPFFNGIWKNCGFERPPEQQAALAKGFEQVRM